MDWNYDKAQFPAFLYTARVTNKKKAQLIELRQ